MALQLGSLWVDDASHACMHAQTCLPSWHMAAAASRSTLGALLAAYMHMCMYAPPQARTHTRRRCCHPSAAAMVAHARVRRRTGGAGITLGASNVYRASLRLTALAALRRTACSPTSAAACRVSESLRSVRGISAFAVSPQQQWIAAGEQMAGDHPPQASAGC